MTPQQTRKDKTGIKQSIDYFYRLWLEIFVLLPFANFERIDKNPKSLKGLRAKLQN